MLGILLVQMSNFRGSKACVTEFCLNLDAAYRYPFEKSVFLEQSSHVSRHNFRNNVRVTQNTYIDYLSRNSQDKKMIECKTTQQSAARVFRIALSKC